MPSGSVNAATLHTLEGHTNTVESVAALTLPDGTPLLLSGSDDKTVRVWTLPENVLQPLRVAARAKEEELNNECSFFFVDAAFLRAHDPATPLPVFQELRDRGVLREGVVRFRDVVRGVHCTDTLIVSHRWEEKGMPDPQGVQLRVIKEELDARPEIVRVWIDWCCMPQGERSGPDKAEFKRMLPRINMLYLGCSVLLIVDNTYATRFWTQFEAWLAMRKCTANGLGPAKEGEERFVIRCIHLAKDKWQGGQLREMWQEATADQAYETLSSADVMVTNQSDKEIQLTKLKPLNQQVQGAFAEMAREVAVVRAEAERLEAEASRLRADADVIEAMARV